MTADEELRNRGMLVLIAALGEVQAARFISLLRRTPFDYTNWRANLWADVSVESLSRDAMQRRAVQNQREEPE
jgi:hypothetical protein